MRNEGVDFDDDLMDAEILVGRFGLPEFTDADLAEFFGCTTDQVRRAHQVGQIPRPAIEHIMGRTGGTARWTKCQVVEIQLGLLRRGPGKVRSFFAAEVLVDACGTPAGYRRHLRAHEPQCEPCAAAQQVYNREIIQRRRRHLTLVDA